MTRVPPSRIACGALRSVKGLGRMDDKERLRHLSDKQVLTTGEAAELCNVSQQTIIRCFDNGRLTGFRVPGSRFRRIPRAELIRFMKANEIPVELLDGDLTRILVVDDDPSIVRIIGEMLEREDRFEVRTASTGYDAGMMTREFRPNIILLDYTGGRRCRRPPHAAPSLRQAPR